MNIWANNIFYIVFLGQILLISYLVPSLLQARMSRMLAEYPPERYSKLYPWPIAYYRIGRSVFKWVNRLIVVLGFVLLYGAYALDGGSFSDDGGMSEIWPAVYGAIQFLPLVTLELLGFRQLKRMREANHSGTRKADLRPRRLFDHVSPVLLAAALTLFATVLGFNLTVDGFAIDWGSDAIQQSLTLAITNALLLAVGLWQLYGRKLDPHQAADDRSRRLRAQLTSLLLVSSAMSVFFLTQAAGDVFDLHAFDATLLSLYFQAIVLTSIGYLLHAFKLEDIDFDVYANDVPVKK